MITDGGPESGYPPFFIAAAAPVQGSAVFFNYNQENLPMATKTKTASNNGAKAQEIQPGQVIDIRHVLRRIGADSVPEAGIFKASEVEAHLREKYLSQGWDLDAVHFVRVYTGRDIGTGLQMDPIEFMYILVKRAA